jgi:predicted RNA binding protein YcfA (HicA-like mRNA interferase family)
MKFRELEKIVMDDGWFPVRSRGSHHHYHHKTKTGTVTIPYHNKEIAKPIVNSVLKQAGLK